MIFLIIIQSPLSAICVGKKNNVFYNPCYGIEITKPDNWIFEKYQNSFKSNVGLKVKNIEYAKKISKCPLSPCVFIIKHKEPYFLFNPRFMITPFILNDKKSFAPELLLKQFLISVRSFYDDFEIIKNVCKIKINNNILYQVKIRYLMKLTNNKEYRIISSMALVVHDNVCFIIDTKCQAVGNDFSENEFTNMIKSIKFY